MRTPRVYIASPYTFGDKEGNVLRSMHAADKLLELGFAPYCPLLNHYQDAMFPRSYEDWLALDLRYLEACCAVIRLAGPSAGAGIEVRHARRLDIPVFYSLRTLLAARDRGELRSH